ncbi:MAG: rod shape-determining protein MreC [Candidatus Paceibacterota bacterium]|jgi:cell shape-determining protein MreC
MTYLRTHNNALGRRQINRGLLVTIVVICVLVVGVRLIYPHLIPAFWMTIAKPFWRADLMIELGSLKSPQALLSLNEELRNQLALDEIRLSSVSAVEAENSELRALMGRASSTDMTLAAVLIKPPYSMFDEIIIDAGADLGFAKGDMVYATGPILIGKIGEVEGWTSKVILFSSPNERHEVYIGSKGILATAVGRGGGQFQAQLPRDAVINKGDIVTIPSLGSGPFGTVVEITVNATEPFQTVLFAPTVNIYSLRFVLVDTNTQ